MALVLPDYRVLHRVGIGANSELYCVQHLETGEYRCAKHVTKLDEDEQKFIDQLKSELAAGQKLDHPVLRKVYELRTVRKFFRLQAAILFMEYIDGIPMSSNQFRPSLPVLLSYFRRAAEGLYAMHQKSFVHADLKPGNLLITKDREVKLIDFGQSSALMHAKERIQGTPDYMAPEQAKRSVLDQRTDVFGLGATLFKIVTGRAIKTEMNRTAGLHMPTRVGKRLSDLNKPISVDVPAAVMKLIEDCCREDPVERMADMRAVINRIDLTQTILERRSGGAHDEETKKRAAPRPRSTDVHDQ